MSISCYYAPADPSYYNSDYQPDPCYRHYGYQPDPNFYASPYQFEPVPPWVPDYVPPIEDEPWPARDYPEYVGNIYQPDEDDDMWLEPAAPERPRLEVLESGYRLPWKRRKEAQEEPAYTPVADLDAGTIRAAAKRVEFGLSRLVEWVVVNGVAGIEDLIQQMLISFDLIEQKVDHDAEQRRLKLKAKTKSLRSNNPGQLKLVT